MVSRASHALRAQKITKGSLARAEIKRLVRAREHNRNAGITTIPTCPLPTCECVNMPADLNIEMKKDLNGTMAAYSDQILVPTGQSDWKSKIEDEKDTAPWGALVSGMKSLLGPNGKLHDPYRNVVISTASFTSPDTTSNGQSETLLYPSFLKVKDIESSETSISQFLESFILRSKTAQSDDAVRQEQAKVAKDQHIASEWAGRIEPILTPTILICSHHSRDSRCGVLGPLLHAEFVQYINKRHSPRNKAVPDIDFEPSRREEGQLSFACTDIFRAEAMDPSNENRQPINVGMISHIGGHAWAGNVIVYIPPGYRINPVECTKCGAQPTDENAEAHEKPEIHKRQPLTQQEGAPNLSPLAGKGVWYGRVQPKHVEGIIEQTIGHGKVIRDLFRGGVNQDGSTIRL